MGIISRILSFFRRGSRTTGTRTARTGRRGLISRLVAAVRAFVGGGRRTHRRGL